MHEEDNTEQNVELLSISLYFDENNHWIIFWLKEGRLVERVYSNVIWKCHQFAVRKVSFRKKNTG